MSTTQTDAAKLHGLLQMMDVPLKRFVDLAWLQRNIRIRNADSPFLSEAEELLKRLVRAQRSE